MIQRRNSEQTDFIKQRFYSPFTENSISQDLISCGRSEHIAGKLQHGSHQSASDFMTLEKVSSVKVGFLLYLVLTFSFLQTLCSIVRTFQRLKRPAALFPSTPPHKHPAAVKTSSSSVRTHRHRRRFQPLQEKLLYNEFTCI